MDKKIIAVIPARYQSSRFPGKPLAMILGKSMIQRVYERVRAVDFFMDVIVATDDQRIRQEVERFGGHAVMTGVCNCGTERVYQAVCQTDAEIIINIQGDEPLIKGEMIKELADIFEDPSVVMATLKKKIDNKDEIMRNNIVKVVTDQCGNALYFSRSPIPCDRDHAGAVYYKHIGIYGYTKDFLGTYVQLPQTEMETIEKLEQLRVLENGYQIRVKETIYETFGVDLPEQISQVETELRNRDEK